MNKIIFPTLWVRCTHASQPPPENLHARCSCSSKYPELKNLATKLCTTFGSTYVYEAVFS